MLTLIEPEIVSRTESDSEAHFAVETCWLTVPSWRLLSDDTFRCPEHAGAAA